MGPDPVDMEVATRDESYLEILGRKGGAWARPSSTFEKPSTLYSEALSIFSYQCNQILLIGDRPSPHSDSNLFRMFMGGHGIFRTHLLLMEVSPAMYFSVPIS
jgi:hypothetical protein